MPVFQLRIIMINYYYVVNLYLLQTGMVVICATEFHLKNSAAYHQQPWSWNDYNLVEYSGICIQTFDKKDTDACNKLECGPMPNLMVALPNIGGALCSTTQSLADAHY